MTSVTFAGLLADAARLAVPGRRRILGITGSPGAGKSTLAERLVAALDGHAVLVGMDGFHLAQRELRRLGRTERKGAEDTFDAAGYVDLLARLRRGDTGDRGVVYAPEFRRDLEEPIACAIPVSPEVPLVVTEGNYLLVSDPPWDRVRPLLDEVWFLAPPEDERIGRLIARHMRFGRTRAQARERVFGSDAINAALIAGTAALADRVLTEVPEP